MAVSVVLTLTVVSLIILTLAFLAGRSLISRIMAPDIEIELVEEPFVEEQPGRSAV